MAWIDSVPRGIFFGWRVVGTAFVFAVFSWGVAFYGPSVFLHELHQTPLALAVALHSMAAVLVLAGRGAIRR